MKRKRVLLLLCILSCTLQLFAQQINVQGVVYDPSGYGAQNETYIED